LQCVEEVVGLLQREPVVAGWEERNCIANNNHSQQSVLGMQPEFCGIMISRQFSHGVFSGVDLDENDWHSLKMLRGNILL
jgi:hypothetical protein